MGKKGKGRGRGRGASGSDAPGSEEQRPGPSSDSNRGRGRGRGQSQPQQQASKSPEDTKPTSEAPREQKPPTSRPPVPQFFESAAAASSTSVPSAKTSVKRAEDSQPTQSKEAESGPSGKGYSAKKKVEKSEQGELLAKFTGLSLEHKEPAKYPFAKRPNYPLIDGNNRIPLFVNYFKISFKDKNLAIYHYDIDISDSTKDKKIGKSVMAEGRTLKEDIKQKVKHVERQQRRNMGKNKCREIISRVFRTTEELKKYCPVYDGQKNLFTSKPLPCKKGTQFPVDITLEGKDKRFFVTISPVVKDDKTNVISMEPLKALYEKRSKEIPYEVLLVYETIMSHREPPFKQVNFRNSFFDLQSRDKSYLGCGLEIWRGYHQAVQLTEVGPVVVINLAAKAFHKAVPVIEYATDVLRTDITRLARLNATQIRNLTSALKGVQVKVTHQRFPRKYKIKNVTDMAARDITLEIDRRRISVPQYFIEKYQKKLDYPQLPCLLMQTSSTTHIPMETCVVVEGQPKVGKLSGDLTSQMIRNTAVEPRKRMDIVTNTASSVNALSRDFMNSFGLLMDIKLMQIDGHLLAAPKLTYDNSLSVKPDNRGVWRIEGGMKFFRQVKINNWVLISFADERCGPGVLNKFCEFLVKSGRKCGISIDRPQGVNIYDRTMRTEIALERAKKSGAQMVIVVLNRRDVYHTYDQVKFLADFKYNLVTQCMEDRTLGRINDQITTNVCLKINVKLGGINHILHQKPKIFERPVIVLGIDAIHWTRGYGYPSILAIVGSLNPTATRYALACDLQRNDREGKISQEIIRNMRDISKVVLLKFQEVNGLAPKTIIVFRDGVSEGQFQHALDYEVSGLQEACQELYQQYLPITYMVVQKRHQTRFFPARASDGVGKMQNVPPGTCVDRVVTHPVYFDYFICSHEGIQGTSKPAKYTVLHDDLKLQTEQLQQLCYFLCHTYVRCTRSVSLPAPVMYADLAAARAKKYADHRLLSTADTVSLADSDCSHRDLPPDVERAIREMQSFDNNMFYV